VHVYEIGDKVKVLKTGYEGKIVGKKELLGKITYLVEQTNGHNIEVSDNDLRRAK
jgi:hypothetical protein